MNRIDDLNDKDLQIELRSNFQRDGYIFYPGFLNEVEIKTVQRRMEKFIEEKLNDMPKKDVYYEDLHDKNTLKQLQRLFQYDFFFLK